MTKQSHTATLQHERIRLRPWQRKDDIAQRAWPEYHEPLSELWNLPRPVRLGDGFFSFLSHPSGDRRVWAVEDHVQRLIGRLSLREIDHWRLRSRLGISLGAPYVGRGLGTRVMKLFLDYYFGGFGFVHMSLDVAAFNRRAVRCYERLGFVCVGHEWRNAGYSASMRLPREPLYHEMPSCFRQEAHIIQVLFYEMELHKAHWLEHNTAMQQPGVKAGGALQPVQG